MSLQQSINQVLGTAATVTSITSQPLIAARKEAEAKASDQEAKKSKLLKEQKVLEGKNDIAQKNTYQALEEFESNPNATGSDAKKLLEKSVNATNTHLTGLRKQIESAENAYIEGLEEIDGTPTLDYIKRLREKESTAAKFYKQKYTELYSELEKALKTREATAAKAKTSKIVTKQQKKYMEELRQMGIPESVIMSPEVQKQLK